MKKNVLTILAVTGTFSVIYLLYKYKRRSVKKHNIEKAMETDAGLNSLEKENILYKVYVNDSAVVRVCSGEENFNGDITNLCKNSITENVNLEKGSNEIDSIAALYSLDLVVNENLDSAEANSINLTQINLSKFLNCSNNSEEMANFNCRNVQMSINNLLNRADMRFLDTNGDDSSDLTFLSPSIINLDSVDEMVNNEMFADIPKPQNGDIADKDLVGSFNELNFKDLNSVNIENGKSFQTPHIDNSVEGKQCNLNKLNTKVDNTQESLQFIDNANEISNNASSITSVAELNIKNHSTNLNLHSMVNGFEKANLTPASNSEVNYDIPELLNEPNLNNNEVKQESSNANGKKKRRRRKKKNSDSDSSSRSSSSENNGNSSPTTKLNVDEMLPKKEIDNVSLTDFGFENIEKSPPQLKFDVNERLQIDNVCFTTISKNNENSMTTTELNKDEMFPNNEFSVCFTNSSNPCDNVKINENEENNGNSMTTTELNIDEMFPKNEINSVCFTNSSFNPCDNINLNENEGTSVSEVYLKPEGTRICEETYPIFKDNNTIYEEAGTNVGSYALNDYHLACENGNSSVYFSVPVTEPQSLAEDSQCLPERNGVEANFIHPLSYEFSFPKDLAGRLIGKNGSFAKKLKEANVTISISNHKADKTLSICTMYGSCDEEMDKGWKMIKGRLPPDVALNVETLQNNCFGVFSSPYQQTICENEITIPNGINFEVKVSCIQSVGEIWIQQPTSPLYSTFDKMHSEMKGYYGDGSKVEKLQPKILNDTLAACKLNGSWYRCLVTMIENEDACVRLLDVGGIVRLPVKNLRQPVVAIRYLAFQASFVFLYGLEPPSGSECYSVEGEMELIKLVQNKTLIANVCAYTSLIANICAFTPRKYPLIKLYIKTEDQYIYINKQLVDKGYARWSDYVPDDQK